MSKILRIKKGIRQKIVGSMTIPVLISNNKAEVEAKAKQVWNKFSKKLFVILLLLMGWGTALFAEHIVNYHNSLTIKQSGEVRIVETIHYDFEETPRHGIFRDIPCIFKGTGVDFYDFHVEMDGGIVEWNKSIKGEMISLKIGSPSKLIKNKHTYTISYRTKKNIVSSSQDGLHSIIRWNLVGSGWKIPILHSYSDIFLPDTLNRSNVSVRTFMGHRGSIRADTIPKWINPHQLHIETARIEPGKGLTVEISFPVGLLSQVNTDSIQTQNGCSSKEFMDLLDTAEIQTQAAHYKEALEAYRKAYRVCPMKELEEMMAWLMGEVGDDDGIPTKKAIGDSNSTVVTLERTICYGTCPIYKITIFADGRVQYIGKKFVRIAGTRSAKISKEKVDQLIDSFQKAGFFSLKDSYTTEHITDFPSAIISITVSGKTKTVTHYHGDTGAPKVLNELENRIDQTVDSQKWIRGDRDDKSVPF